MPSVLRFLLVPSMLCFLFVLCLEVTCTEYQATHSTLNVLHYLVGGQNHQNDCVPKPRLLKRGKLKPEIEPTASASVAVETFFSTTF